GVVRRDARRLRGLVDAVNVTDNATARVGMTPLAAAMLAAGEGLDPGLQLTCRDRNRLALTADPLGAHAPARAGPPAGPGPRRGGGGDRPAGPVPGRRGRAPRRRPLRRGPPGRQGRRR